MYTPVMTSDSATVAIRLLVGAEAPDEVVDRVVRIDGLTGVSPEALDDVVLDRASPDEVVVHVRDLELAPRRRCERREHREHRAVVEVHAGHGVRARGVLRLLGDAAGAAGHHRGDAEWSEGPRGPELS